MKEKKIIVLMLAVLLLLFAACGNSQTVLPTETIPSTEAPATVSETEAPLIPITIEQVEFVSAASTWDWNEVYVTVRNISPDPLTQLTVRIDYLNENGDILNDTIASTYTIVECGQAITLIHEFYNEIPYSIRIASGHCSTSSDDFIQFYFDSPYTYICEFEDTEKSETSEAVQEEAHAHEWVNVINKYGVRAKKCPTCGASELETEDWTSLTACKLLGDSNSELAQDVKVGHWRSVSGKIYPEALKFWVADYDNASPTEWVKYDLEGKYETLSGVILVGDETDPDASMQIRIYFGNDLVYESTTLYCSEEYYTFKLDVSNVDAVRIECLTRTETDAYCIVTAAVW